jgi:small-conductance mechanosensitive channel
MKDVKTHYRHKVCRLRQELDETRRQAASQTTTACKQQTANTESAEPPSSSSKSTVTPSEASTPSDLRLYIDQVERQEDRRMRDQLSVVKDFGRRLERIEDIGCSYFKPRAARCRIEKELYVRLEGGQLRGVVSREHLRQVPVTYK